jgi:hypothetical protein
MGIEPTPPAWKAGALPLSYTRNPSTGLSVISGLPFRIGLLQWVVTSMIGRSDDFDSSGFDPHYRSAGRLVEGVGFEPT